MPLSDTDAPDQPDFTRPPGGMTRHALTGMFWLFSSSGVQSVLNLFVTAILARLLTPADFGLMAAAVVVIGLTEIFQMAGIGPALIQRPSLNESHIRSGLAFSLVFGFVLIAALWLLAPLLAGLFIMPELTRVLRVLAFVFPIHAVSVISRNLIQRSLRFRHLAGIDVVSYLLGFGVVGVALAWMGWGVWALVAARLALAIVNAVILFVVQPHRLYPQWNVTALRELLWSAGGFTMTEFLSYTARRLDSLVTGRWLGSDALGVYSRALAISQAMIRLPGHVLNRVLFASFAKVQQERERLSLVFGRGLGVASLLMLQVSVVTLVLADEMVAVLLGAQWTETVIPLRILSLVMLFSIQGRLFSIVARSCGDVYRLSVRQGIFALLMFLGAWCGQFYGVSGVAAGVALAMLLHGLMGLQQCIMLSIIGWRSWFSQTSRALWPALLVGACIAPAARGLRALDFHPALILGIALGLAAAVFALILLVGPSRLAGNNGGWFLHYVNTYRPIPFIRDRARVLKNV